MHRRRPAAAAATVVRAAAAARRVAPAASAAGQTAGFPGTAGVACFRVQLNDPFLIGWGRASLRAPTLHIHMQEALASGGSLQCGVQCAVPAQGIVRADAHLQSRRTTSSLARMLGY